MDEKLIKIRKVCEEIRQEFGEAQYLPKQESVEQCRALLRRLQSRYEQISGQCGAMDKITGPLRWEIMGYLNIVIDEPDRVHGRPLPENAGQQ